MNELQLEMQSISCILAESWVPYHYYNESNLFQLLSKDHRSSIISDVNANFHSANNISNYDRSKKAGKKHIRICYNNIIPILIFTFRNYYKHNPEVHLLTKEYLITGYVEYQKGLSNICDITQDIEVI